MSTRTEVEVLCPRCNMTTVQLVSKKSIKGWIALGGYCTVCGYSAVGRGDDDVIAQHNAVRKPDATGEYVTFCERMMKERAGVVVAEIPCARSISRIVEQLVAAGELDEGDAPSRSWMEKHARSDWPRFLVWSERGGKGGRPKYFSPRMRDCVVHSSSSSGSEVS